MNRTMVTASRKVALVTGASKGIGKACAQALLQAGWNTVFVGRNREALLVAMTEAGPSDATAMALACDVSQSSEVQALFREVESHFGRVDLLFNNAGMMGPAGTIDEISVEAWRQTLAVNLEGAFLCSRAAFAMMKRQHPQGGRIINNGSIAAQTPRPGSVPYAVSKHAITGLTKCLSLDGRPFNIACGQIDIGNVLTEMTHGFTQGMLQANGERMPEPVFELKHVVDAVLYMAGLPPGANVQFMTVMATNMPFIGRG